MKKFLPIAMAAVMSMSAVAVSAVSANAVEPLNTPVQYAQVARASLATPKISKAESVYGGVKLTWNKVNGAAKYRVYYKGSKGWTRMVDTTSTSYIDKDVSSGRNYTYTVRCISKDGKKFTSGYDSKGKTVKYVAAPKISKVESVYDGTKITWNKVTGAEKYRVYYKDRTGWNRLVDTTGTSVVDNHLFVTEHSYGNQNTRENYYTVRCISKDNKKFTSGYDAKGKTTADVQSSINIQNILTVSGGIKLEFDYALPENSKYRIYRKENGSWKRLAETYNQYYTDKNVKAGKSYTYTVRGVSKDGKKFTTSYNPSGVTLKYKTTNKTRDDFVNYLMNHQSEWLPDDHYYYGMLARAGFEFMDLDFDGNPEFFVQESGSSMSNFDAKVYSFKNGKMIKANYSENYIQNMLNIYYNKSSKKYEVFGVSTTAAGFNNDHAYGQFQLKYNGSNITTDYFAYYYIMFPLNSPSGNYEYTYYNGADGYYRGIGNHKKISKSSYNDIMRNKFANLVNVHKHSQFIYRTEAYNPNWNDMSYAQKKQALLDSYDSFSYDKY
nr:fibronectin type III domain-containing protein [uncultured Ruminococcus sp.]